MGEIQEKTVEEYCLTPHKLAFWVVVEKGQHVFEDLAGVVFVVLVDCF